MQIGCAQRYGGEILGVPLCRRQRRAERGIPRFPDRRAVVDAGTHAPGFRNLPGLLQAGIGKQPRAVLGVLLLHRCIQRGAGPWAGVHADAGATRVFKITESEFLLDEQGGRCIQQVIRAQYCARRIVLIGVVRQRLVMIDAQVQAVLEEGLVCAEGQLVRLVRGAVAEAVARHQYTGIGTVVRGVVDKTGFDDIAVRLRTQVGLAEHLGDKVELVGHVITAVDTVDAGAGTDNALLAEAEACFLFAVVDAAVKLARGVAQFGQVGVLAVGTARLAVGIFHFQLRALGEVNLGIDARQGVITAVLALVDIGSAEFEPVIYQLDRSATTVAPFLGAVRPCFIIDNDVNQVEVGILAGYRLFEEQRTGMVVDVVIDVACHRP